MIEILLTGLGMLTAGLAVGRFFTQRKLEQLATVDRLELQAVFQEKQWVESQLKSVEERLKSTEAQLAVSQRLENELRTQLAVSATQQENQIKFFQATQEQLTEKFQMLAQQALEANRQTFMQSSSENLKQLLGPLRERLQTFEKRLEEDRVTDARSMGVLQHEIKKLAELNQQISVEAQQLTRALKGDVKLQGNWGEMVLEKILEASGLRDGMEFSRQSSGMDLRGEEGEIQRPDIIVHLPEGRHLVLDSKVSLKAYERWAHVETDEERSACAQLHVESLIKHIRGLAEKSYQNNGQVISPDFVMLFIPIEAAFSAALQMKPDLFQMAWERKVVLVSPTTLLATLRTVESIWRQEKQTRNALEIARVGGGLYDEFVRLLEEFSLVGTKLKEAQSAHDGAVKRLAQGRGNLMSRVETLRELGARTKKQIPEALQPEL